MGGKENSDRLFSWLQNHWEWWLQPWKSKMLAPCEESYDKPRQCIEKQRHHFTKKVHLVKAIVFPVVMYRCECWTIKKAEHWRIDAFEVWSWKRLWESFRQQGEQTSQSAVHGVTKSQTWLSDWTKTERKSTLNIHWKDWCWSCNTLAIWWEEPTHLQRPWCWKSLRAGGEGGNRGGDG